MPTLQLSVEPEQLQSLLTNEGAMASLLQSLLNQVLQAQATEQIGAEPYERTETRTARRNGTRSRSLTTRVGRLELAVPQLRDGVFTTDLFQRYQRTEQALIATLMELVVNGVSTRKVARITEELCGQAFSKSTVSDLCQGLDAQVQAWRTRSLAAWAWPFVLVDALVLRVREDDRVVAKSALVATGIREDGTRSILGLELGNSESEASWSAFFAGLQARGLRDVELVVSDDHQGLIKAIRQQFQGALWQRCQTHFLRNLAACTPAALQEALLARTRAVLTAPDRKTAKVLLDTLVTDFAQTAPASVQKLEDAFDDVIAVLTLPAPYHRRLRTTNPQERLNAEIRRRERVIRIFPSEASAIRLIGAYLMEYDDQWTTGRRYLDMTAYWAWKRAHPVQPPLF